MLAEDIDEQRCERLRRAMDERNLMRLRAAVEEAPDLLRDELQLGALAAALEQLHGPRGMDPRLSRAFPARLEEAALQVAQRGPRGVGIVAGRGCDDDVLARPRQQRLEGRRALGKRNPARLEGERHRDGRIEDARKRLDRIELERREVVEAVEEDRCPPRAGPAPARR